MCEVILYKGDCLVEMNKIADKSVDMILCDLPYECTVSEWDSIIPFDKLWEQYNRIIKDNCVICLFSTQPFTTKLIASNVENFKYEWIWHKSHGGNFALAKSRPLKEHENIEIFCNGTARYFPIKEERHGSGKQTSKYFKKSNVSKSDVYGIDNESVRKNFGELRYPSSVQYFNSVSNTNGKRLHPTQKPTDLLEYLIKTYTLENETVLDNCMGSGSTGVACINTKRNFIGIEKDDKYFEIAKDRIKKVKESLFEM